MTISIRMTPRVLKQTAADLEHDAAAMEARAMAVANEQRQRPHLPGTMNTANHLQTALYNAARLARQAADEYQLAARYTEALDQMSAAPFCPQDWQQFSAAELEQAEGFYEWGGVDPIPAEGQRVQVLKNELGPGVVKGYFLSGQAGEANPDYPERRFLGVFVQLDSAEADARPSTAYGPDLKNL